MRRMYGLSTYMKGEEWPHEQGEMYVGKYSHPMEHLGMVGSDVFPMQKRPLLRGHSFIFNGVIGSLSPLELYPPGFRELHILAFSKRFSRSKKYIPPKLTWNLKMHPWKRKHIYKLPIFWVPC